MSKRILFSPVGGTDPISSTNMHDGSLLHICRYYRPDVVYLYMSGEILENEKKDDRYMYCLHRLDAMQDRATEYVRIEKPKLRDVQEFDFFYGEFRTVIRDIANTMADGDELLLNVSSGTPAMKSGLLVQLTGYTGRQIMSYVRRGLYYAGFRFKGADVNSYDEMNRVIVEAIDRKRS